MGVRDWRARRAMKDPVRGQFQVTDRYFAHPGSSSFREMLTGVVTGPGIVATAGEHLSDSAGRWVNNEVLPALVDRADPATFIILWDEVAKPDFRAQARQRADQAAAAQNVEAPRTGPDAQAAAGFAYDADAGSGLPPQWESQLIADLTQRGILPGSDVHGTGAPTVVNLPPQVIDLTAGHLSAADAAQLTSTGVPAMAVLTAVVDVVVPQEALPGPTASLCDLSLQVTRSDGQSYAAQTRLGFRDAHRRALIAVVGSTLPVRVDPTNPNRVAVDVAAFNAQHPSQ